MTLCCRACAVSLLILVLDLEMVSPCSVLPGVALALLMLASSSLSEVEVASAPPLFRVEGKVYPPDQRPRDWFSDTRVVVDGGRKVGFLKVRRRHMLKTIT